MGQTLPGAMLFRGIVLQCQVLHFHRLTLNRPERALGTNLAGDRAPLYTNLQPALYESPAWLALIPPTSHHGQANVLYRPAEDPDKFWAWDQATWSDRNVPSHNKPPGSNMS